jgi:hypothetical protein
VIDTRDLTVCGVCSAVVDEGWLEYHARWHQRQDQVEQLTLALARYHTAVHVGGLDPRGSLAADLAADIGRLRSDLIDPNPNEGTTTA